MKREELLSSKEYWMVQIQNELYGILEDYMAKNNLNRTQLAEKLNVTKGYVTQVLKGDFNHKISKLVGLSIACNKVPIIHFVDLKKYILDDEHDRLHIYEKSFEPVKYYNVIVKVADENLKESNAIKTSGSFTLTVKPGTSPLPQFYNKSKN
jgi:transcriptional regulator with XRE-family HTH domain